MPPARPDLSAAVPSATPSATVLPTFPVCNCPDCNRPGLNCPDCNRPAFSPSLFPDFFAALFPTFFSAPSFFGSFPRKKQARRLRKGAAAHRPSVHLPEQNRRHSNTATDLLQTDFSIRPQFIFLRLPTAEKPPLPFLPRRGSRIPRLPGQRLRFPRPHRFCRPCRSSRAD